MSHDHDDHHHAPPDAVAVRVKAIEGLLAEKGLVDPAAMDEMIDIFANRVGPQIGANLVARAWTEPEFKARLLRDANEVLEELEIPRLQAEDLIVLENTPTLHHVVVCTLCSCYPWGVLGLPPNWYKAPGYRSRVVREPRRVLKEFGYDVPADVEIRVWDSTAELRYMVLPMRPAGTEGMGVEELTALVTRDSMIGVSALGTPVTA